MAGRPREFDRDEALAKARDAFWERGYEGTSMTDLVDALGLASARIYAAFGSKEQLFREAVTLYASGEGGFAGRALAEEPTAAAAIERMFREAIDLYTRGGQPRGCMVVSAAVNCTGANSGVEEWVAALRRVQTAAIIAKLKAAVEAGELEKRADAERLGDFFSALLHGLSVQARDGVSRARLRASIAPSMSLLRRKA